jgi:hypothetical protein
MANYNDQPITTSNIGLHTHEVIRTTKDVEGDGKVCRCDAHNLLWV